MGLRPLACWDCGFEFRLGHGCLSVVSVVFCQVEACGVQHNSTIRRITSQSTSGSISEYVEWHRLHTTQKVAYLYFLIHHLRNIAADTYKIHILLVYKFPELGIFIKSSAVFKMSFGLLPLTILLYIVCIYIFFQVSAVYYYIQSLLLSD